MYVTSNTGPYSIDTSTNNLTKLSTLENGLGFITDNKNENNLYCTYGDYGDVIVIDGNTNQIKANISIFSYYPGFLEYNPLNDFVYMSGQRNGVMSMMKISNDANKLIVQEVENLRVVKDMTYSKNNGLLYFIGINQVIVVDPKENRILESLPLNSSQSISFNPKNNYMYILNSDENNISVLS